MGHNFVLLTKGTDAANFATAAMTGKATEYILSKGVLNHTKLIGGGESTTIQFTTPAKEAYDFICNFSLLLLNDEGRFIVE